MSAITFTPVDGGKQTAYAGIRYHTSMADATASEAPVVGQLTTTGPARQRTETVPSPSGKWTEI